MVPQTLWGNNLRALLSKQEWDVVRRNAYDRAGNRCRVCGARGQKWPVEADEAWDYDDQARTQTLKGVVALCPDCHHVRHWGKSMIEGREDDTLRHVMVINRWTREQAERAAEEALTQWEEHSKHEWRSDHTWVTRVHGFVPDEAGAARAEASNLELVSRARRRAEEADRMLWNHMLEPETPSASARRMVIPRPTPQPERRPDRSILGAFRALFR